MYFSSSNNEKNYDVNNTTKQDDYGTSPNIPDRISFNISDIKKLSS